MAAILFFLGLNDMAYCGRDDHGGAQAPLAIDKGLRVAEGARAKLASAHRGAKSPTPVQSRTTASPTTLSDLTAHRP
jgi:hypothetical protein